MTTWCAWSLRGTRDFLVSERVRRARPSSKSATSGSLSSTKSPWPTKLMPAAASSPALAPSSCAVALTMLFPSSGWKTTLPSHPLLPSTYVDVTAPSHRVCPSSGLLRSSAMPSRRMKTLRPMAPCRYSSRRPTALYMTRLAASTSAPTSGISRRKGRPRMAIASCCTSSCERSLGCWLATRRITSICSGLGTSYSSSRGGAMKSGASPSASCCFSRFSPACSFRMTREACRMRIRAVADIIVICLQPSLAGLRSSPIHPPV
mmetsp:Transcript_57147/g.180871  ORF Transcript_57147/g.180871 Transcript_57147/m.180871 type:complete len:262 (-) Transcript_57147:170-955(-)